MQNSSNSLTLCKPRNRSCSRLYIYPIRHYPSSCDLQQKVVEGRGD